MPWFVCGDCGDTIKKPKVEAHAARCSASTLTCVDCSRDFDRWSVKAHVSCVTEHDKYAKGATKPGGAAANGYYDEGEGGRAAAPAASAPSDGGVEGAEHLSSRFPWKCNLCGVTCTSQETLLGHASGLKHRRRARAAAKNKNGGGGGDVEEPKTVAAATSPSPSTPPQKGSALAAESAPPSNKDKKKKRKQEEAAEENNKRRKSDDGKPPKWKKLALTVLSESSNEKKKKGIKVSKLVDAVLRAAGSSSGDDDEAKRKRVEEVLRGSKKFRVEGGRVTLAAK